MADKSDVLIALYEEERVQARQSESQRSALTNIVLIVVSAGLAFISADGIVLSDLALSVPMIFVGAYGAVSSAKYFERWYRHWHRAAGYRSQLFELHPDIKSRLHDYSHENNHGGDDRYETEATKRFPHLHNVKIHRLWVGFHVGVMVLGLGLSVLAVAL